MTEDIRYKGDDFGAFGGDFLTLNVTNNTGEPTSLVAVQIGNVLKKYPIVILAGETGTLHISMDSRETKQLMHKNKLYAAAYDSAGRKLTCQSTGEVSINVNPEVVTDGSNCQFCG